jgi:glutamate 5-kinase
VQVIKIGTSSLINEGFHSLNLSNLARVCEVIKQLHNEGGWGPAGSCGGSGDV